MEWSGRAPAPPASYAGKGRQRQGARYVFETQHRNRRSWHRYWQELFDVSAHASARDLNLAPAFEMVSRMLRRSLVLRANRSSLVTSNTSPLWRAAMAFDSCFLSVTAPLNFSANILSAPLAFNAAC